MQIESLEINVNNLLSVIDSLSERVGDYLMPPSPEVENKADDKKETLQTQAAKRIRDFNFRITDVNKLVVVAQNKINDISKRFEG